MKKCLDEEPSESEDCDEELTGEEKDNILFHRNIVRWRDLRVPFQEPRVPAGVSRACFVSGSKSSLTFKTLDFDPDTKSLTYQHCFTKHTIVTLAVKECQQPSLQGFAFRTVTRYRNVLRFFVPRPPRNPARNRPKKGTLVAWELADKSQMMHSGTECKTL
ncbi:hypothetical protein K435DRAFT_794216 [Dendrothele bispora CBS 962.96]|uniref:Uncharacterized protein n=1 Tax=Dendrothele bispora (strain CBS 962.96) TaxID=1314807 RepID=A0A4S8MDA0_DENBC|nr:hypothetical protein K435DRAFT_794216 [Dendrothele bispora CBS 962.96]